MPSGKFEREVRELPCGCVVIATFYDDGKKTCVVDRGCKEAAVIMLTHGPRDVVFHCIGQSGGEDLV